MYKQVEKIILLIFIFLLKIKQMIQKILLNNSCFTENKSHNKYIYI